METQSKLFRPNKSKNILLLIICLTFVSVGFFVINDKPFLKWLIILFFGIGIVVSLLQFYPNSSYLKLTEEGFEVKSLFRSHFTKWSEIDNFRLGNMSGNDMIFFDYTDEHKKWKYGKKVSKFLTKKDGAIQSSYNISTIELFDLLLLYKSKSL